MTDDENLRAGARANRDRVLDVARDAHVRHSGPMSGGRGAHHLADYRESPARASIQ
jgi:hypothetical protein